jgi:hypothetical protein
MESTGQQGRRVIALAVAWLLSVALAAAQAGSTQPPAASLVVDRKSDPNAAAAACKQIVDRFVHDLDGLMAESPRSLDRYNALLAWYFPEKKSFSNGSGFSVAGCDVNQLVDVVKRSKFLHEIGRPPQYAHYRIEFRGRVAKVFLSIDPSTGNIIHTGAWWIQPYI